MTRLRVGTRGSALALAQVSGVARLLEAAAPFDLEVETVVIRTTGDRSQDKPFADIGPRGVFAAELEDALLRGEVDLAVHSLKDLPSAATPGLVLAAVPPREDARDVLVSGDGSRLADLRAGAVVGTSSERRRALVRDARPDLALAELRGNVDTRLEKVRRGDVDAAILAAAGILRLGRGDEIAERLDPLVFVPAPGQGALAVQAREEDLAGWLSSIEDAPSRHAVDAERAFALTMEGGCSLPLGAWARSDGAALDLTVFVGREGRVVRESARGSDAVELGRRLAEGVLARTGGALA